MDENSKPPLELFQAVSDLWKLKPPGPKDLGTGPVLVRLRDICQKLYFKDPAVIKLGLNGLDFALDHALRALGLPLWLNESTAHLALSAEDASSRLDTAFRQSKSTRRYLCPLDCADAGNFPALKFGPASIRRMSAVELEACVDVQRLKRFDPTWVFNSERLSEFIWLVVEERVALDGEPASRAMPGLFAEYTQTFGSIEPHPKHFPTAVEGVLFALLLVPWEDWLGSPDVNWRAFNIPWVYTVDDDLFRQPTAPPLPESLSWQPEIWVDRNGDEEEVERPIQIWLGEPVSEALTCFDDAAWSDLMRARQSPLFESPVEHFLIRGFLSDGIDEFLAHIMVIEAALGMQENKMTARLSTRLSALLGSDTAGDDFKKLFDLRCQFVHGRAMKSAISGQDRLRARQLARQTAGALVKVALEMPGITCRQTYLNSLLSRGHP